jgi:hypothetical protein
MSLRRGSRRLILGGAVYATLIAVSLPRVRQVARVEGLEHGPDARGPDRLIVIKLIYRLRARSAARRHRDAPITTRSTPTSRS